MGQYQVTCFNLDETQARREDIGKQKKIRGRRSMFLPQVLEKRFASHTHSRSPVGDRKHGSLPHCAQSEPVLPIKALSEGFFSSITEEDDPSMADIQSAPEPFVMSRSN